MQSEEISKLEIFSSFADNVIVMKISSGKKGSLNFNMNATTPHIKKSIFTKKRQLIINGTSGSVNKEPIISIGILHTFTVFFSQGNFHFQKCRFGRSCKNSTIYHGYKSTGRSMGRKVNW